MTGCRLKITPVGSNSRHIVGISTPCDCIRGSNGVPRQVTEFDSDELIKKSIEHINDKLFISELQYTTTIGRQKSEINEYELSRGDSFVRESSGTYTLKHAEVSQIKYDLIGKIAEATTLTRKTISKILQGIRIDKLYMFQNNPEEFITKVSRLINEQKATMIETVAITLWKAKGNLFYLLNFSYIGGCLALGTALFTAGKRYDRHFLGVFEAATIHYAVAKIFGPLFFNPACSLR